MAHEPASSRLQQFSMARNRTSAENQRPTTRGSDITLTAVPGDGQFGNIDGQGGNLPDLDFDAFMDFNDQEQDVALLDFSNQQSSDPMPHESADIMAGSSGSRLNDPAHYIVHESHPQTINPYQTTYTPTYYYQSQCQPRLSSQWGLGIRNGPDPLSYQPMAQGAPQWSEHKNSVQFNQHVQQIEPNSSYGEISDANKVGESRKRGTSKNLTSISPRPPRSQRYCTQKFQAEHPERDPEHSWVRINSSTRGKSSRTGKINKFNPQDNAGYELDMPNPIKGGWTSQSGHSFSYNRHYELQRTSYSIEEIKAFIYEYPRDRSKKQELTMLIQRCPADSGKRYPTQGSDKCRFEDCPAKIYSRSIGVGWHRVAFDEHWSRYGDRHDPFIVSGYVHLYCMERFLDFPDICARFRVEADRRHIPCEPNGRFGGTLDNHPDGEVAERFVQWCKEGKIGLTKYLKYPVHDESHPSIRKYYEGTLSYAMTKAKNSMLNNSKLKMLEQRGLKNSNILIHVGNLAMQVKARRHEKSKKKRNETAEDSDDNAGATAPPSQRSSFNYTQTSNPVTMAMAANAHKRSYAEISPRTRVMEHPAKRFRLDHPDPVPYQHVSYQAPDAMHQASAYQQSDVFTNPFADMNRVVELVGPTPAHQNEETVHKTQEETTRNQNDDQTFTVLQSALSNQNYQAASQARETTPVDPALLNAVDRLNNGAVMRSSPATSDELSDLDAFFADTNNIPDLLR